MQQKKLLPKKYYYLSKIDERDYSKIVWKRKDKLILYEKLICEGCTEKTALEAISVSRATLYRWKSRYESLGLAGLEPCSRAPKKVRTKDWSPELIENVLIERKKHPIYGKQKITVLLKNKSNKVPSESTVGRILKHLIDKQRVHPADFYTGKYNPKPRNFNSHAKRIPPGMKAKKPGELIQVDHMTVSINSGKKVKHFQAICPLTRYSVAKAFREASSLTATKFLLFLRQNLPFQLLSIQVDGGSEFMGEFEKACKELNIPLYVLPPRSPKMNAFVERMNGTVKYEFYSLYDKKDNLEIINAAMQEYERFYNERRPHAGLQNKSPLEYSRIVGGL